MKKIWLNVSFSSEWIGPAVGIIRTEIECAKALHHAYGENFHLCRLRGQSFHELSWDAYFSEVKSNATAVKKNSWNQFSSYIKNKLVRRYEKITLSPKARTAKHYRLFDAADCFVSLGADWLLPISRDYQYLHAKGVKIITCCYDLIPLKFPQYVLSDQTKPWNTYFSQLIQWSDCILCISECSRRDLNEFAAGKEIPQPKTEIIHLGSDLPDPGTAEPSQALRTVLKRPYILYVSSKDRRKNHEVLYRAYTRLLAQDPRRELPLLVLCGRPDDGSREVFRDIALDPLVKGHILNLEFVADSDLNYLYRQCLFVVFPSLYEGWGLGVVEALNCGKFVLASDAASLPEAGGKFVEYIDPWRVDEWAKAIAHYATDTNALLMKEDVIGREYSPIT